MEETQVKKFQLKALRGSIITALVLFILDAYIFNQGIIAAITLLVVVFWLLPKALFAWKNKAVLITRSLKFVIYLIMSIAVFSMNTLNNSIARDRAENIISACNQYQLKYQHYPQALEELVPEFLPSIPVPKLLLINNKFRYFSNDGQVTLMYVKAPPYGRAVYDFSKQKWGHLD